MRTAASILIIVFGVILVGASLHLGTDPELASRHRVMAAGLAPAGMLLLFASFRLMRTVETKPTSVDSV